MSDKQNLKSAKSHFGGETSSICGSVSYKLRSLFSLGRVEEGESSSGSSGALGQGGRLNYGILALEKTYKEG